MNDNNNICLFDMDGTLCDFDAEMERQLALLRSPWEIERPLSKAEKESPWYVARRRLIKAKPGFWENLPRLEHGFDVLDVATALGFEIHVLTQGPTTTDTAWTEKKRWCDKNLPDGIRLTITQKKSLAYGKVIVDDWPDYFMSWLEFRPRGLVVAVAHPWNEHIRHPQVIRYDGTNLDEVRERMKAVKECKHTKA